MNTRLLMPALLIASLASAAEVELTDQVRENFAVATVAVAAGKVAQQWTAAATVLDVEPLLATVTELRAAQAAGAASASELKRSETLQQSDNNVSLKVVEAARAQAAADRSRASALRAQLLGRWGTAIARLSDAQLDQLTDRILQGRVVLVRVEIASVAGVLNVQAVQLRLLPDGARLNGRMLGAMPQRAEQAAGRSYLISVEAGNADLQAGQVLGAELQDAARTSSGIVVPRAALLRWQGSNWVYVQTEANHYQRRGVQVAQWSENTVLVNEGLAAGDQVVTRGAGLLLGAEFAPAEAEDE